MHSPSPSLLREGFERDKERGQGARQRSPRARHSLPQFSNIAIALSLALHPPLENPKEPLRKREALSHSFASIFLIASVMLCCLLQHLNPKAHAKNLFVRLRYLLFKYTHFFFIRTCKFWSRLVVLKFLHNLNLNCSFKNCSCFHHVNYHQSTSISICFSTLRGLS